MSDPGFLFHVKHELSASEYGAISGYVDLLKLFNAQFNLYSASAYDRLPFHVEDSVHLARVLGVGVSVIADMGSGSGLPSVILAILNPGRQVVAIESKEKKRVFLREVKRSLGLSNFEIFDGDVQAFLAQKQYRPAYYTAKAFAPLEKLKMYLRPVRRSSAAVCVPISLTQRDGEYSGYGACIQEARSGAGVFYYAVIPFGVLFC